MRRQNEGRTWAKPVVVGTGLIALDIVVSDDPSQPLRPYAGGTCGNVLSILAFLGWDAYPIARLNGDTASRRVKADMKRWGVHLDFAECEPTTDTPIIVQIIQQDIGSEPHHRFAWVCPMCGHVLPRFKPVTTDVVESLAQTMGNPAVFFLDRVSRAALDLARIASGRGAVVVFEPSGKVPERILGEVLELAHIVKYSGERIGSLREIAGIRRANILEVQTLGPKGLRYRNREPGAASQEWKHMGAYNLPALVDTCGAGDWCTAGLIAKACRRGLKGLFAATSADLEHAIRYGQALAAWNCGFEGARGGMYQADKSTFDRQVSRIMRGGEPLPLKAVASAKDLEIDGRLCPACDRDSYSLQAVTGQSRRRNRPATNKAG